MAAPRPILLAVVVAGAALVGGCATGPRPSFDAEQPTLQPTGDPAVDAVLDRLEGVEGQAFTADYQILTRLGGLESTATVVQTADSRRSVTVNDVRFIDSGGTTATCALGSGEPCENVINDARVSDVQLTHDFYAPSMARRLRVDAGRSIGDTTGYEVTQAGQTALCVDVPVTGGTKVYCALESGLLARYDGADLFIELTELDPEADESKFATG
jgi:hypothetical protein